MTLRRDTPRPRGPRWHVPVRVARQAIFAVVTAALLVVSATLAIGGTLSADESVVWGTFRQTDCEPKPRGGCRSVGVWMSDDRTIRKIDVYLDGSPNSDGTVRAAYRPHGFNNDNENNIVHVEMFAYGWVWAPRLLTLILFGMAAYYWRRWWPRSYVRRSRP